MVMNKQIQQLIDQATTRIDPTAHDGACWDFDKEKFAQLIVRECAEQVDWILAKDGRTQGDLIREHFGVKE
jgi:hypothetical protein